MRIVTIEIEARSGRLFERLIVDSLKLAQTAIEQEKPLDVLLISKPSFAKAKITVAHTR